MTTETREAPTVLKAGIHATPQLGMSLLEAVAYVANEPYSDQPECCCPVLAKFGQSWNNLMRSDEERDQLLQYVPRLVNTAVSRDLERRRRLLVGEWLLRVYAPVWLDAASFPEHAETLRTMQPANLHTLKATHRAVSETRERLEARVYVPPTIKWDARGAAGGVAAELVARDEIALWAADIARDALWCVATNAARWKLGKRRAATEALEPTVVALQREAHTLFDAMIAASETP